jgi:hypothetical protein
MASMSPLELLNCKYVGKVSAILASHYPLR